VIVEIQTFKLASGVSEEQFLEADARLQAERYYQDESIVRRTTTRSGDKWCVVVFSGAEIAVPDELRELVTDLVVERYEALEG